MSTAMPTGQAASDSLLTDFSLEMTGKDVEALRDAAGAIPAGTRINVTFLANEDLDMRVAAARAGRELGFVPVPHISARRLQSVAVLDEFLDALTQAGASENVFVIAGDPETPEGPFEDALAVIKSGVLERHGVKRVSISGYPEGHPDITDELLWSALDAKAAALSERGLTGDIITQFGFDVDPVIAWIEAVRERGIEIPIRIGVPGPAGVRRLLAYAKRCGIGTGTTIARKYGLSLTNLMSTAGPDKFLSALSDAYDPKRHGKVQAHFYTFGGLTPTAEWIEKYLAS